MDRGPRHREVGGNRKRKRTNNGPLSWVDGRVPKLSTNKQVMKFVSAWNRRTTPRLSSTLTGNVTIEPPPPRFTAKDNCTHYYSMRLTDHHAFSTSHASHSENMAKGSIHRNNVPGNGHQTYCSPELRRRSTERRGNSI